MTDRRQIALPCVPRPELPEDDSALRQLAGTPRRVFEQLHSEYHFTVDAAALPFNAKLDRYWSPDDDGLSRDWVPERVWCNPPYDDIKPWAESAKMALFAALLLPARTDRRWFQGSGAETHFFVGRMAFEPPPGVSYSSNPDCNMLLLFGQGACPGRVRFRCSQTGLMLPDGFEAAWERRAGR